MEDNSIYILKNYGVTKIKLKEILLEKALVEINYVLS